jgi:hypothetical protein
VVMFGSREGSVIGGFLGCLFGSASRVIGFQGDVGWGVGEMVLVLFGSRVFLQVVVTI